jgi:hypothetical protein
MKVIAEASDHRRRPLFCAAHRASASLDGVDQATLVQPSAAQGGQFSSHVLDARRVGSQIQGSRAPGRAEAKPPISGASRQTPVAGQITLPTQRLEFVAADA